MRRLRNELECHLSSVFAWILFIRSPVHLISWLRGEKVIEGLTRGGTATKTNPVAHAAPGSQASSQTRPPFCASSRPCWSRSASNGKLEKSTST